MRYMFSRYRKVSDNRRGNLLSNCYFFKKRRVKYMYRTIFRSILALSLLLLVYNAADAQSTSSPIFERRTRWTTLDFIDGGFQVASPGPLTEKIDTVAAPVGELVYHTYFYTPPTDTADNVVYMASYVDYPAEALHSDSTELLEEFFAVTIDAATESVRGELLFATEFALKGYPGRYWRIDYLNGRASVRTRAFVVKNRYYAIQTISRSELGINPSTDRFLDSFRLY